METQNVRYGCVYCKTGYEAETARHLCDGCICLKATPAFRMEHRFIGGKKTQVKAIMLPGYVFFMADERFATFRLWQMSSVIRLLADTEQCWHLQGGDLAFAKWVFENDGLIGMSKVLQTGSQVRILSGPMKDFEGAIIKINRHARSGIVAVKFDNNTFNLKLSFEIVEEIHDF